MWGEHPQQGMCVLKCVRKEFPQRETNKKKLAGVIHLLEVIVPLVKHHIQTAFFYR